ncbi:hypothetical protein Tco_0568488 [Tanacetum coccineum]
MNPQETQQVAARDEKWVPFTKRVKISSTNIRLETTVPQKEETFQVVIDLIKNSKCFKAFTIYVDKCVVNADVFRTILDIFPRVEGVDFTDVPDDDATLDFLIKLGYKGPLYKHTNMFMDHMHQPWRTLATIINKCLSGKTSSNDKLRKSKTNVLLKFFKTREDYQEYRLPIPDVMPTDAIKQSESYQMFIKYSTCQIPPKKSRGKGSQGKKTTYTPVTDVDVFKESNPKLVRKRTTSKRRVKKKLMIFAEDNIITEDPNITLELGKSINFTEAEKEEAVRKVHATHAMIVTEYVPEPTRRKPSGKVTVDPPKKLKSTGDSNEGTGIKPRVPDESTIVFATSSEGTGAKPGVPDKENVTTEEKNKSIDLKLTDDEETEDEFIHRGEYIQTDDEESNDEFVQGEEQVHDDEDEEMPDAEVANSDKGDEEVTDAAKADAEKTSEVKDDAKKAKLPPTSLSLLDTIDATINSLLEVKIQSDVLHIQSPSMLKVLVFVISEPSVLALIPKTPLATHVTTLPPPSVSTIQPVPIQQQITTPIPTPPTTTESPIIITVVHESNALIAVELRVEKLEKDMSELKTIDHLSRAFATLKRHVPTIVDDYLGSKLSDALQKALQKHTTDLTQKQSVKPAPELRKIKTPTINLEQESKKSTLDILMIKREQAEKQKMPQLTIKSTDKEALKEYDLKNYDDEDDDDEDPSAGPNQGKTIKRRKTKESKSSKKLSTTKEPSKEIDDLVNTAAEDVVLDVDQLHDNSTSCKRQSFQSKIGGSYQPPKCLLILILEWNMLRSVLDQPEQPWFNQMVTASEDPLTYNDLLATKTGKTAVVEKPVKELIAEVEIDDLVNTAAEDVVLDVDQLHDNSTHAKDKVSKQDWFRQPPRPPIPDLEWNKRQYVLNRLKIDNLTQDILLGPAYNLLKGTCTSSIELEYHFQECFNAITDKLDWNNPEGDRYPFDLSKPLPLRSQPGHQTIAAEYFFNNDLEFLKSSDPMKTYTTSITKKKAAL